MSRLFGIRLGIYRCAARFSDSHCPKGPTPFTPIFPPLARHKLNSPKDVTSVLCSAHLSTFVPYNIRIMIRSRTSQTLFGHIMLMMLRHARFWFGSSCSRAGQRQIDLKMCQISFLFLSGVVQAMQMAMRGYCKIEVKDIKMTEEGTLILRKLYLLRPARYYRITVKTEGLSVALFPDSLVAFTRRYESNLPTKHHLCSP